jgi:hypothetical protein
MSVWVAGVAGCVAVVGERARNGMRSVKAATGHPFKP